MAFREELRDYRSWEYPQLASEIRQRIAQIRPADAKISEMAGERWASIAKPLDGLGILERDITDICAIRRDSLPCLDRKALVIFCADNGVVKEGVAQTGAHTTAQVTANITRGTSCSSLMAKQCGADVYPIDIGVKEDIEGPGDVHPLSNLTIRRGTRDFLEAPAMTRRECLCAILTGMDAARVLRDERYEIIAGGEMGIANTTTSSAVTACLLDADPASVTGRGSGLPSEALAHKIDVIREGIRRRNPDRSDPIDVLENLGGYDIAGLTGLFLGAAVYELPIVADGLITLAAALAAVRLAPAVRDYIIASHCPVEHGAKALLRELHLDYPLEARLGLGEGTGALLLFPLLSMTLAVYRDMMTFDGMDMKPYRHYS